MAALSMLLLTGCATGNIRVDSDVSAFARWPAEPAKPGSRYRFERLPSQEQSAPALLAQNQLEAATQTALAQVGMVMQEGGSSTASAAQFSVQVSFATRQTSLRYRDAYDGVLFGGGLGFGSGLWLGGGNRGASIGLGFPFFYSFPERPEYAHVLTLVLRDRASGQVVFETSAQHESYTNQPQLLLPAMLEAALRGFPEPPVGVRRLSVQVLTTPG